MILIVTTEQHRYTHASVEAEPGANLKVVSYGEIKANAKALPKGTYVFTDTDRLPPPQLTQAALYYRALRAQGQPVLNDPARVLSRFGLLRALNRSGINDFDAYRVEDLEEPRRWPVFLRTEGGHGAPLSDLLHNRKDLGAAIEKAVKGGMPRSTLLVVEYAAEPVAPGLFRKLSAFRVGDQILGHTCVHDDQWVVKYGKRGIATPEMYQEEYDFVRTSPFAESLRRVFDIAGMEYGRVDFGLVGGRPQIYEINSNPDMKLRPKPAANATRDESNTLFRENYIAALKALDEAPPGKRAEEAPVAPARRKMR